MHCHCQNPACLYLCFLHLICPHMGILVSLTFHAQCRIIAFSFFFFFSFLSLGLFYEISWDQCENIISSLSGKTQRESERARVAGVFPSSTLPPSSWSVQLSSRGAVVACCYFTAISTLPIHLSNVADRSAAANSLATIFLYWKNGSQQWKKYIYSSSWYMRKC